MCHLALVEVDPKTGQVKILDYVAVHDAGTVVNPTTLAEMPPAIWEGHVKTPSPFTEYGIKGGEGGRMSTPGAWE